MSLTAPLVAPKYWQAPHQRSEAAAISDLLAPATPTNGWRPQEPQAAVPLYSSFPYKMTHSCRIAISTSSANNIQQQSCDSKFPIPWHGSSASAMATAPSRTSVSIGAWNCMTPVSMFPEVLTSFAKDAFSLAMSAQGGGSLLRRTPFFSSSWVGKWRNG